MMIHARPVAWARPVGFVVVQLAVFTAVAVVVFEWNRGALYFGYDGAYMRQLVKLYFEWSVPTSAVIANPLQGLGHITFPINYWLAPATLVSFLVNGAIPDDIIVYTVTALELFGSTWLLGWAFGLPPAVQLGAAWLISILAMPFLVPPPPHASFVSFYAISGLIPWIIEHIAATSLMLTLVILMHRSARPARFVLWALAFLAVLLLSSAAFPATVVLSLPLICLALPYVLVVAGQRFSRGLIAVVVVIWAAAAAAPAAFLAGLFLDSVPVFFNNELVYGRPGWEFISILFHGPLGLGWMSSIIYVLGTLGATAALFREAGFLRVVAAIYLGYCGALLLTGVLTTFWFEHYRGPSMLYFEWFTWPLMFIFATSLVGAAVQGAARVVPSLTARLRARGAAPGTLSAVICPLLAIATVLAFDDASRMRALVRQFATPPAKSSFVAILAEKTALSPGAPWRGSVATFNGIRPDGSGTSWVDNVSIDGWLWSVVGNDHRSFGLWWHDIPTLFSYNNFMTPDYYFLMTRLFAQPQDLQQRSVVVLSRPDMRLLPLFGTRFIISRRPLPDMTGLAGELQQLSLLDGKEQHLYELARPNLGNFAPTRAIVETTAGGALAVMRDPGFDPAREVVVSTPVGSDLVDVAGSVLHWERDGLHVSARSEGRSLLVLPLHFSNCLEVIPRASGDRPALLRVNVGLAGLLFTRATDVSLQLRYGPFQNVLCKIRDYRDLKGLAL
jgi:hypothetical protein